jgi:hypothetical protein
MESFVLSEQEVKRLFGVLMTALRTLSLKDARTAVAAAGITGINSPTQYWDPFLAGVERVFGLLEPDAQLIALRILANQFHSNEAVRSLFMQHGFQYLDGAFIPVGLLDQREAKYLPQSSAAELAKATKRLVDGDETGAITAACGAVDALMQNLYAKHGLGDPSKVGFAAKVGTALAHLRVFEGMNNDFVALGLKSEDAVRIVTEMRKATNHASEMLQILRRTMGDVHGSKAALTYAAYDAIKWASAICGLFEGR